MSPTSQKNSDDAVNIIKSYIAPALFSIIGLFLWRDVSEMRADLKTLLSNQSANEVKIQTLQADVTALKSFVYNESYEPFVNGNRISLPPAQPAKKEEEIKIKRR